MVEIGESKIAMDRSLLAEASKLLDGVGKKINSLHREVLQRAMKSFVENDIPFIDEKILSPKFANEFRMLTNTSVADLDMDNMVEYMKTVNAYRSAARTYASSPTRENAIKLHNTFFRDFYDTLIKGSNRENWFAPSANTVE